MITHPTRYRIVPPESWEQSLTVIPRHKKDLWVSLTAQRLVPAKRMSPYNVNDQRPNFQNGNQAVCDTYVIRKTQKSPLGRKSKCTKGSGGSQGEPAGKEKVSKLLTLCVPEPSSTYDFFLHDQFG